MCALRMADCISQAVCPSVSFFLVSLSHSGSDSDLDSDSDSALDLEVGWDTDSDSDSDSGSDSDSDQDQDEMNADCVYLPGLQRFDGEIRHKTHPLCIVLHIHQL